MTLTDCQEINVTIEETQPIDVTIQDGIGVNNFFALLDTPGSYEGQANKILQVKSTEDGIEFTDSPTVVDWGEICGDQTDINLSGFTNDLDSDSIPEGEVNLYFSGKTTDNLTEGSTNLYDKEVTLTAGDNVSISGDYPNFTINSVDTTYVSSDFDHNSLTNTHNLTTDIDHNALTNYSSSEHFTQSEISITENQISDLKSYQVTSEKGQNGGYADLDEGGKIPLTRLPSTLLIYKGVWNADTNTPTLTATDENKKGWVYNVGVPGTQFGIAFSLGDWAIYNDAGVLEKSDNSDDVVSVNGQQGVVVLDADDISDTLTTNKFVTTTEKNTWNGKQDALTNPVTGTGTTNYIPKFTATSGIGNSIIYDDGTKVGIGTTSPFNLLTVKDSSTNYPFKIIGNQANSQGDDIAVLQIGSTAFSDNNNAAQIAAYRSGADHDNLGLKFRVHKDNNYEVAPIDAMTIEHTGNVGIGTTSPSQKLDVAGNINIDGTSAYLYDGVQGLKLAKGTDTFYANTFVGQNAGNVTAYRQTAVGYAAGQSNTGSFQTALGYSAGYLNIGVQQTAVGYAAGESNTGPHQTAVGYAAGQSNTGSYQTALGMYAGQSNTGTQQTALGYAAGYQNTGHRVTGVGYEATRNNSKNDVVAIGYQAGKDNNVANQFIVKQANLNSVPLIQGDFVSGNVGIGTTSPSQKLDVAGGLRIDNDSWISARDYSGAGVVNLFKVNENNEIDVGGTLNIGTLSLSEDSGLTSMINLPVSATPSDGTQEAYTFNIDSDVVLKVHALADGSGGVDTKAVIIATEDLEVPDTSLSNGQTTFYLDETSNTLTVKCKYSDGTVKTGTIALS